MQAPAAAGVQPGPLLSELAAAMCRAQGPSQALVVAAAEVTRKLPSLAYMGLAVAAEDRQSVRYSVLLSQRQGAARLGAVAASSCAGGLAIDAKQVVHVRDLSNGDLGLHDLQYLQQEHQARACFVTPLVVAENALGALSLASLQPDAFRGHEGWLQAVAAMCAPYVLLLKSHEGLLALEGLVSQVLPVRVALQLQDRQRRSSSPKLPPGLQQQLPLQGPGTPAAAADAQDAGASAVAAAAGAVQSAAGSDAGGGGSSLRALRAAQRLRHQQPRQQNRAAPHQQPAAASAQGQQPPRQRQQQPLPRQLPPVWEWLRRPSWTLAFGQPRLEQAYRRWALQQWLLLLDSMFLLLVLLSALGSHVRPALSALARLEHQGWGWRLPGVGICECMAWLLAGTVVWALCSLLRNPARADWGDKRTAALVAVRVLRTFLLCCELWRLQTPSNSGPKLEALSDAGPVQGTHGPWDLSRGNTASCGLLLMLGLLGQLPSPLHAAVQAACVAVVSITLLTVQVWPSPGDSLGVGRIPSTVAAVLAGGGLSAWLQLALLFSAGWLLPVVLVAGGEWASRRHFLQKIM